MTPTGAAIATTLATRYAEIPAMTLRAIGYGAGTADLTEKANVLRLLIGEIGAVSEPRRALGPTPITVIETNVDDMSPQIYGYFVERALAAGALDVFSTPVQMKKNRPGLLVTILCEPAKVSRADRFGVSRNHHDRRAHPRSPPQDSRSRIRPGRNTLRRSAHESLAHERLGAERHARIRRLPAHRRTRRASR